MMQTPMTQSSKWTLRLVLLATALALTVVFVAENFVIVEIRLLGRQLEVRLAWALLMAGGMGLLLGLLLPRPWR